MRSACVSAYASDDGVSDETYSLAWYCVQLILDKLRDLTSPTAHEHDVKGKGKARDDVVEEDRSVERVHRLRLVLISMVSSLPLLLMSRVLEEIRVMLLTTADSDSAEEGRRKELVDALFGEFLEGVGDREKEAAIRWWYQHRPMLISGREEKAEESEEEREGKGTGVGSWIKGVKEVLKDKVNEELGLGRPGESRSDAPQSDLGVVSRL